MCDSDYFFDIVVVLFSKIFCFCRKSSEILKVGFEKFWGNDTCSERLGEVKKCCYFLFYSFLNFVYCLSQSI